MTEENATGGCSSMIEFVVNKYAITVFKGGELKRVEVEGNLWVCERVLVFRNREGIIIKAFNDWIEVELMEEEG